MDRSDAVMRLAVLGARGRMGARCLALAAEDPGLEPALGIVAPGEGAGLSAEGVRLEEGWPSDVEADVLVDFSQPGAVGLAAGWVAERGAAWVCGTTGLEDEHWAKIDGAAERTPVLWASNFSAVVQTLFVVAAEAARLLGKGYDAEIVEAHHKHKRDAPSGTALELARRVAEAKGLSPDRDIKLDRQGDDLREASQLTVQALRFGDTPGEHTLVLGGVGERLELRHQALSRDSYVVGALRAAKWLAGRSAGRYEMAQVLGIGAS
ncbi:MAG: 4-hydroxy-tetrahydrodipicolinate reductase [Planctomycetota bacterium]